MYQIAPVKMMVIDIRILAMPGRITQHCGPGFMIVEHKGDFSRRVSEPVLHAGFYLVEQSLKQRIVAGLAGNAGGLHKAVEQLAVVV